MQAGFAFRAQTLHPFDLELESPAEVAEGVVTGDQHACLLRHRREHTSPIFSKAGQLLLVRFGIGPVVGFVRRVVLDERVGDNIDAQRPQIRVHPDVRIGMALRGLGLEQGRLVDALGHRNHRPALAELGEHLAHLPFEQQPAEENDIGFGEAGDVVARGLVEVRIDALAHDDLDPRMLTRDVASDIADHADGGHNGVRAIGFFRAGLAAVAPGQQHRQQHGKRKKQSILHAQSRHFDLSHYGPSRLASTALVGQNGRAGARAICYPCGVPTVTVENYLKHIYLRQQDVPANALVAMGELAVAVGVTPGSATSMVKTLEESNLLSYTPRGGVRLTRAGERLARQVLRRHRLIELFLVETLQMDWAEVHTEAEELEHAVSDKVLERIDAHLGYPDADPHGDPIPRPNQRESRAAARMVSLAQCVLAAPVEVGADSRSNP